MSHLWRVHGYVVHPASQKPSLPLQELLIAEDDDEARSIAAARWAGLATGDAVVRVNSASLVSEIDGRRVSVE